MYWYCDQKFLLSYTVYYRLLLSGFSITIMKSDESILQRLDAATKAPYWPVAVDGQYWYQNYLEYCVTQFKLFGWYIWLMVYMLQCWDKSMLVIACVFWSFKWSIWNHINYLLYFQAIALLQKFLSQCHCLVWQRVMRCVQSIIFCILLYEIHRELSKLIVYLVRKIFMTCVHAWSTFITGITYWNSRRAFGAFPTLDP